MLTLQPSISPLSYFLFSGFFLLILGSSSLCSCLCSTGFYWVLPGFTGFYCVFLGSTVFLACSIQRLPLHFFVEFHFNEMFSFFSRIDYIFPISTKSIFCAICSTGTALTRVKRRRRKWRRRRPTEAPSSNQRRRRRRTPPPSRPIACVSTWNNGTNSWDKPDK